MPCNSKR